MKTKVAQISGASFNEILELNERRQSLKTRFL